MVWKFRSMRHEAADARAARQVTADDDRVTRVGRFLRTTSLDELPAAAQRAQGRDVAGRPPPARHRHEDRRERVRPAGRRVRPAPPHQARA